jgi:hypothetical protein
MDLLMKLLLIVSTIFAVFLVTGCAEQPVHREYVRDGKFDHYYERHYKHEGHHLPHQHMEER